MNARAGTDGRFGKLEKSNKGKRAWFPLKNRPIDRPGRLRNYLSLLCRNCGGLPLW